MTSITLRSASDAGNRKPCPHFLLLIPFRAKRHLSCYLRHSRHFKFFIFYLIDFFCYFVLTVETYRSPVETICTNIDYYIPDNKGDTKSFSEDAMARLRKCFFGTSSKQLFQLLFCFCLDMGRAMIALFIVSFFFDFVAFWTGVVGCWRRGAGNITSTAILMLLACKLSFFLLSNEIISNSKFFFSFLLSQSPNVFLLVNRRNK